VHPSSGSNSPRSLTLKNKVLCKFSVFQGVSLIITFSDITPRKIDCSDLSEEYASTIIGMSYYPPSCNNPVGCPLIKDGISLLFIYRVMEKFCGVGVNIHVLLPRTLDGNDQAGKHSSYLTLDIKWKGTGWLPILTSKLRRSKGPRIVI
jgi:hypothetical protein